MKLNKQMKIIPQLFDTKTNRFVYMQFIEVK